MKIAVEASALLGEISGVGECVLGSLKALSTFDDLELSAFAITWRGRHQLLTHLPRNVSACQRVMPARPLHFVWKYLRFPTIESFVGPVDVIHGMNAVLPPVRAAHGVITVHDVAPTLYPELCQPNFLPFTQLVAKAISRDALVHTPSQFVRSQVIDVFGASPEQVIAVPWGVPTGASLVAKDSSLSQDNNVSLPEIFVLALGTIQPRKDYPSLLLAFDKIACSDASVHLVIAGARGWGYKEFESVLSRLHARERIHYLGYVSRVERERLLARATILVYPSVYEGFGLPPLEAMAHGVPVVSTRAGAIPEVLGDAALLAPVGEPDALAEQMSRLLNDEELRQQITQRGYATVANYTWHRTAEGLRRIYTMAIS